MRLPYFYSLSMARSSQNESPLFKESNLWTNNCFKKIQTRETFPTEQKQAKSLPVHAQERTCENDSGQPTSDKMQPIDPQGRNHNEFLPCLMLHCPWEISTIIFICSNVLLVEMVTEQYQIVATRIYISLIDM